MSSHIVKAPATHEVHFESLFQARRGYCFPCDAHGRVALEALSERARANYLQATALVGRELAAPAVIRARGESARR